jgi:YD repeat-containing protein
VNPESGTVRYTYNISGTLDTLTDARGITTTDSYDALNRLTGTSYNDGLTPSVRHTAGDS